LGAAKQTHRRGGPEVAPFVAMSVLDRISFPALDGRAVTLCVDSGRECHAERVRRYTAAKHLGFPRMRPFAGERSSPLSMTIRDLVQPCAEWTGGLHKLKGWYNGNAFGVAKRLQQQA